MSGTNVCRYCGQRIRWVRTVNDSRMPINLDTVPHGNVVIIDTVAHVLTAAQLHDGAGLPPHRWVHHATTCPGVADRRRKGTRSPAKTRVLSKSVDKTRARGAR